MKTNFIRAILLCGSAMTVACPAIAQAREPAEAASQAAPRADSAVIGEVVVTARRRDERLQDVPVSVTALSAEALERSSVQELRSIGVLSPGLTFTNEGGGGNATLSLRGIGQIPLGEGTPGVVIYVNNMALPPDGSNVPTYDIASIQVLKGPQGTLFGKNTLGGAVLVSSKAPDYHFGGYVEGTYGRFDYREIQGAVNIPLVEDKVALRIAGQIRRQDPRTGSFDGGPGFDNIHQDGVRVSLLVEPVEGLKSTTIAEYYKRHERFAGTYLIRQNFPFGVFFGPALGPILDAQVAPEVAKQHANPRSSYDGGVNGGSGYTRSKSITNDTIYK
ncbi:MAG: TonB-dependent receptor, partial [Caulobacterales bacterium]|nr:TonB-dependent receptor [Caulobacterales bacterium]